MPAMQKAEKKLMQTEHRVQPIREMLLSVFLSGRVTPRTLMSCLKSNRRNTNTINYQAHHFLFASTQIRLSNLSIWPCTIQNENMSNHVLQSLGHLHNYVRCFQSNW